MEKKFKAYERVIVKSQTDDYWTCDLYSHLNEDAGTHETINRIDLYDNDILPYEGNEHLVGTDLPAVEEVRLEEGEICVFAGDIDEFINFGIIGKLVEKKRGLFCDEVGREWNYAIRFSDFNPNDMEETKKHILCVKNGKSVKYKN